MINSESRIKKIKIFINHWMNQLINPIQIAKFFPNLVRFLKDWRNYSKIRGSEPINLLDIYPSLYDRTLTQGFDIHYFYQDIWAFKRIFESKCHHHYDIGSRIDLIGFLTTVTKVTYIDIRPLNTDLENYNSKKGNILSLPFKNNSIKSLSCLHVAEHIGLGRYGDPIDPFGTKKAASELSRVLAIDGKLYFSLPIGFPRLCFNSHRIHSTKQIFDYFTDLELVELSGILDNGKFIQNINAKNLDACHYGCGLFLFTKR